MTRAVVHGGSKDSTFGAPFIDVDEWRARPCPRTARYPGRRAPDDGAGSPRAFDRRRGSGVHRERRGSVRRRQVVAAEWDFDGLGNYPVSSAGIDGALDRAALSTSHAYAEPGTHFATVRVTSHRNGDMNSPHARVQNIARARVIVGAR